jgi:5-formyltetrahydrofolate cyclo-ligase
MNLPKNTLRKTIRALLRDNRDTLERRSKILRDKILALPEWRGASTVGLFASMPEEPGVLELMRVPNKTFVFPCIRESGLVWRAAKEKEDLIPVQPGMPLLKEPHGGPVVAEEDIQLLLVPGLAFTRQGLRLGRGGGFYDRALERFPKSTLRAGVCFAFQLLETLPAELHDQPVDLVLHD